VVIDTLIDQILNDGLQHKTRRHKLLSSLLFKPVDALYWFINNPYPKPDLSGRNRYTRINKKELIVDSQKDLKEEIAKVAYEIYQQKGIAGMDVDNWHEAERIVLERMSVREHSKAAKNPAPSKKKSATKKKKSETETFQSA
jgi:hypothetical protein